MKLKRWKNILSIIIIIIIIIINNDNNDKYSYKKVKNKYILRAC